MGPNSLMVVYVDPLGVMGFTGGLVQAEVGVLLRDFTTCIFWPWGYTQCFWLGLSLLHRFVKAKTLTLNPHLSILSSTRAHAEA